MTLSSLDGWTWPLSNHKQEAQSHLFWYLKCCCVFWNAVIWPVRTTVALPLYITRTFLLLQWRQISYLKQCGWNVSSRLGGAFCCICQNLVDVDFIILLWSCNLKFLKWRGEIENAPICQGEYMNSLNGGGNIHTVSLTGQPRAAGTPQNRLLEFQKRARNDHKITFKHIMSYSGFTAGPLTMHRLLCSYLIEHSVVFKCSS